MHKKYWIVLIILVFLLLVAGILYKKPTKSPADKAEKSIHLADLIDEKPIQETFFQKTKALRKAIADGQFEQASDLLKEAKKTYSSARFINFVDAASAPSEKTFLEQLDKFIAFDSSHQARLLRINYLYNLAWWYRGTGFADSIDAAHYQMFHYLMHLAADDAEKLASVSNDVAVYQLQSRIADDSGADNNQALFLKNSQKFPDYYGFYASQLNHLQPKWGGSVEQMKQFVADAVLKEPSLQRLYLDLYVKLLRVASVYCRQYPQQRQECTQEVADKISADILPEAKKAIAQLAKVDDIASQYQLADLLKSLIKTVGAESKALELLQYSASLLHSTLELTPKQSYKNQFVIDQLVALYWYHQGHNENNKTWLDRALKDLPHSQFSSVNEQLAAKAETYYMMANYYRYKKDYVKAALYGEAAAILLGGYGAEPKLDRLTCEAFYLSKQYAKAIAVCSDTIAASQDLESYYFRARSYDKNGDKAQAIADYQTVADSEAGLGFRASVVINLGLIYGKNHQKALQVLNHYQFIFDKKQADKSDKAVYYNNRCYSKMQLGLLNEALEDCNQSLQYGNIPDALAKKRKLEQKLKVNSE